MEVYAHLFDERDHAERMATTLEAEFGNLLETETRGEARSGAAKESSNVAELRPIAAVS